MDQAIRFKESVNVYISKIAKKLKLRRVITL